MALRLPMPSATARPVLDELADVVRNVVQLDKERRDLEAQLAERTRELAEALVRYDDLEREYDLLKARCER